MKIFKVGGAVRDTLLGYPHVETDWVVVGATPSDLLDQGFAQVGKDFPVFLHPKTKEEYALARTERKSGRGYHGFEIHAHPSVTLEEDLERRDLTINAMAMDDDGRIVDPYGGQADLEQRLLRHVSPHFVEDPLRILRVARFAARYKHLGFDVAPETLSLMKDIVLQGELAHLSVERIWVETERALAEQSAEVYFAILKACGALAALMPALTLTNGIDSLAIACCHTERVDCRWAALLSSLTFEKADKTCDAIKAPKLFKALAHSVCKYRPQTKNALRDPTRCFDLLKGLDAMRRDEPFEGYVRTLAALEGVAADAHPSVSMLRAARKAAKGVSAADIIEEGVTGPALGAAIKERQIEAIATAL